MGSDAGPSPTGCGRGRPIGSDSAETRARILRAAREVINERGYDAANFQAIASRAGLSRPTMHYYFHTREEIYDRLVAETYSIVVDCIARANREDTLLDQLSAFVTAAYRSGLVDGSMIRFTVMARPSGPVVDAVRGFYASIVDDAIARGEIPADTDASAVVSMVLAMFLGMAFYAGFIGDQNDMTMIAKQLYRLMAHGLLDRQRNGHALTMTPVAPVTG